MAEAFKKTRKMCDAITAITAITERKNRELPKIS